MKLIDADALKKAIKEFEDKRGYSSLLEEQFFYNLDCIIDNAPTVNTVNLEKQSFIEGFKEGCEHGKKCYERPHGEWIVQPHSMIMKCSLCGHEENAKDVGTINLGKHFCSFCGADMRGAE